jgi:hypothetical protein
MTAGYPEPTSWARFKVIETLFRLDVITILGGMS